MRRPALRRAGCRRGASCGRSRWRSTTSWPTASAGLRRKQPTRVRRGVHELIGAERRLSTRLESPSLLGRRLVPRIWPNRAILHATRRSAAAIGARMRPRASTLVARSPIDGTHARERSRGDAGDVDAAVDAAAAALPQRGATSPRRSAANWSGASARSSASARPTSPTLVTLEAGKITPGSARRSAGDDRHLRLRRRPVAPALRPDDRQRAARPPDDGAVASARRRSA